MEKLREEQAAYVEFQKLKREIDHLTHIHISYLYLQRKKAMENCEKSIEAAHKFIEDGQQEIEDNKKEVETIETECKEMQERIDAETGGELTELETQLTAKTKAEAQANGAKKSASLEVDSEKRKLTILERKQSKDENALQTKEEQMSKVADLFQRLKETDEKDSKDFVDAQKRFQQLSAGLEVNEDGQASSLQEQLISKFNKKIHSYDNM